MQNNNYSSLNLILLPILQLCKYFSLEMRQMVINCSRWTKNVKNIYFAAYEFYLWNLIKKSRSAETN